MSLSFRENLEPLNAICPYFTMFPLSFPLAVLRNRAEKTDWVLDPFCGRGTTNIAARSLGLASVGIDSHPLAAAISEAKLIETSAEEIMKEYDTIISSQPNPQHMPEGKFWELAFHEDVLEQICRLREALVADCNTSARKALRAVILGALHGPLTKTVPSHFSNQCPRTYAPKPAYAIKYWTTRGLLPPRVDIRAAVRNRAIRYFSNKAGSGRGRVVLADSRLPDAFTAIPEPVKWFITSPPYYGLCTYQPDQWLRLWFLGGEAHVRYTQSGQVSHGSPEAFAMDLHRVWRNCADRSTNDATIVIRFGGIHNRTADPWVVLKHSLDDSGWRIVTKVDAGTANCGRRQAQSFARNRYEPKQEFDVWAKRA